MTETILFSAIGAVCLGLAALGSLVYARVRSYRRGTKAPANVSAQNASLEIGPVAPFGRYQPLFRLLSGEDEDFVRKNQRCPKVVERWEQAQRRVVRLYLRELAADFQALHREARTMAAQSPEEYHYLIPLLFKQQLLFWRALIWIDIRLSLGRRLSRTSREMLWAAFEALQTEIARTAVQGSRQPA